MSRVLIHLAVRLFSSAGTKAGGEQKGYTDPKEVEGSVELWIQGERRGDEKPSWAQIKVSPKPSLPPLLSLPSPSLKNLLQQQELFKETT